MTEGMKSHTTKIYLGDQLSPSGFVKIDEVYMIGPVGGTKSLIDFSNQDSVGYREYLMADLADGDEIAVEANEIPGNTSQDLVRAAFTNSTTNYWQVVYRNGGSETFLGNILKLQTDASELDGRVMFKFTIKIAGDITRVAVPTP